MKVAFINHPGDRFLPAADASSIPIWIWEVARRVAQSGEVVVYATKWTPSDAKDEFYEGVRVRRVAVTLDQVLPRFLRLLLLRLLAVLRSSKRPFFASSWYFLEYALKVAADLRKLKCDLVHVLTYSQFVPIIRAFNPNIKIVLHVQCEWLTQLDRTLIEPRLRKTDLILGCSEYITEKIRHCFPELASRCQTVHNGVNRDGSGDRDNRSRPERHGTKRVLFVGRVSPEKGVHVLLDAFQMVQEQLPQAQLEIVGSFDVPPVEFIAALSDDPQTRDLASFYPRGFLARLRAELFSHWSGGQYYALLHKKVAAGMENRVAFAGAIAHAKLAELYRHADVFVFPSVWHEPFGMPVAEAMAFGVPVVTTRGGGIVEILEDGKSGILVQRGNATALAEAILRLLRDEELQQCFAQAGQARAVEFFSWDRIAETVLAAYRRICVDDAGAKLSALGM